jgi:membrane associated rhomboid family serine protease
VIEAEEIEGRPIWARPDLFPKTPISGWGYFDRINGPMPVASESALCELIRNDHQEKIGLVWTPDCPNFVVPESVPALHGALKESRSVSTQVDLKEKNRHVKFGLLLYSGFILYFWWDIYHTSHPAVTVWGAMRELIQSQMPVLGILMLTMFFLLPWYEVKKRWKEVRDWSAETMKDAADLANFETWLAMQKIVATKAIMGLIVIAGAVQVISGKPFAAALLKNNYDERWRLLTAPFLHGNEIHFIMNALGLIYLGRRIEALARWPHVAMVFLFTAWIGGEVSLSYGSGSSLGASGGLMGMLGFLLVFETRHARLVPRSARRRLMAALIGTAIIGLIGVKMIDNGAHLGGLLGGMIYAWVVFPRSESAMRPRSSSADQWMAALAFIVMAFGVFVACKVMLQK